MSRVARLSNKQRKQLSVLLAQSQQALALGRLDVLTQVCGKIETIQKGNPDVANFRGLICSHAGDMESARKCFSEAVLIAPKRSEFHANLGGAYLSLGHIEKARTSYEVSLKLDGRAVTTQLGYASCLAMLGQPEQAIVILQRLEKTHPHDVALLMQLFRANHEARHFEAAKGYLHAVLEQQPEHAEAHYCLGLLAAEAGDFSESEDEIRSTLNIRPDDADAWQVLSDIKSFVHVDDEDLAEMANAYRGSDPETRQRMVLSFAMGKAMDDVQAYDRAFDYFREGNEIRLRDSSYQANIVLPRMQALVETFTAKVCVSDGGLEDARVVFIVGMPRCGSTLVEQILAAHPDVVSRGEGNAFEIALKDLADDTDSLTCLASFSDEQWRHVGQSFLQLLQANAQVATCITDKTLTNFCLLGAISRALPHAKIVHVRRHPLDTCLSIYKTNMKGRAFDYACDLATLGDYYRMYQHMMQHWRKVLPQGMMYELDYEQLVGNQEAETRKLLEVCGLSWDARCLQFRHTSNTVQTASAVQVRKAMYNDSVAAWKRYEKHLQPLIRILGSG